MNNIRHLMQTIPSSEPGLTLYSNHMLWEFMSLHEDRIVQLRCEHLRAARATDFLAGLIDQHEKIAVLLRTQLENMIGQN